MIESQSFLTHILVSCLLFNVVFVRKFLSEIPEKSSESFLSEVFLPKLFGLKVFDFNVLSIKLGCQDEISTFKASLITVAVSRTVP